VLSRLEAWIRKDDDERMKFDFDFIGVQNYTREIVRHSWLTPYVRARIVSAESRNAPLTEMKWEVYAPSIYHALKKYAAYPGVKKIIVTENGAAFPDVVEDGRVNDIQRVNFLRDYLSAVLRAKQEGCPVAGYFVWTLTDNFEWAEGYRPRFGLIHVDFDSQQRTVKDSGKWYSAFIKRR
jgi:beta-glucosidase